ncbi:hypothetical protein KR018_008614, partial [Drosophila ironensis]
RPSAGAGAWLCCLLPLALGVRLLHAQGELCQDERRMQGFLFVTALGMALKTLCFYVYAFVRTGILVKCLVSLLPGAVTSLCLVYFVQDSAVFGLLVGFLVTVAYQHLYISAMRGFERSFTYGEASILVQGLVLFAISALNRFWLLYREGACPAGDFEQLSLIMVNALFWLLNFCVALFLFPVLRQPLLFYVSFAILLLAVTLLPVTQPLPVVALLQFLLSDQRRLGILAFYVILAGLTALTVTWQLGSSAKANTRVRKVFHLLIVLVYVPGLLHQCELLYLATGVALAVFVVLELVRLLEVPPLGARLAEAFAAFKDEKDAGQLALTPFCLLIGCSLPVWLTPCPCSGQGDAALSLLAGILAVGVGDTAASVVGSKLGRNKWSGSSRSVEGTLAFVASILLFLWLLHLGGWLALSQAKWFAAVFGALNAALVEAFTDQVDNLVLPLVFYIIVGLA